MRSPQLALSLLLLSSMATAGSFTGRRAAYDFSNGAIVARQDAPKESGGDNTLAPQSDKPQETAPSAVTTTPPATTAPPTQSSSMPTQPNEPETSAEPETSVEPKPEPEPETQTTESSQPPADPTTEPPANSEPTTPPTAQPTSNKPDETSKPEESKTSEMLETSAPPKTTSTTKEEPTTLFSMSDYTTVVVVTVNGEAKSSTQVSKTAIPTATQAPANINSDPDTSGGMSQQTKNTVIGVVCGVGGAILLAVLGFGWFKWNSRRKQRAMVDDGDELVGMNAMGSVGNNEKFGATSPGSNDPFKSNLESYHQPGRANPGTNF